MVKHYGSIRNFYLFILLYWCIDSVCNTVPLRHDSHSKLLKENLKELSLILLLLAKETWSSFPGPSTNCHSWYYQPTHHHGSSNILVPQGNNALDFQIQTQVAHSILQFSNWHRSRGRYYSPEQTVMTEFWQAGRTGIVLGGDMP